MTQPTNIRHFVVLIVLLSVPAWNAYGQEAKSPSDESAAAKSEKKEKDEKEEAKKDVEVAGVFEAVRVSPIKISPKEWSSLTVVDAVEHGEEVDKGDVLIELDTEKIDDAITDAEDALTTEELNLESAEIKFNLARRNRELSMAATEKADRVSTEELKEFIADGRDRRVRSYERSVKSARNQLEYQEEELKQLERMYKADDLTEETEEIILKRTRNSVDSAKYFLDSALNSRKNGLKYSLPRTEEELETSMKQTALALEEAKQTASISMKLQELALAKQKLAMKRNRDKLERLRGDRELFAIRAPAAGVVYYGAAKRGKWSNPSTIAAMLVPGGTLKPKSVVMTVVQPNPVNIRISVPEASRRHVKPGTKVTVSTVAYPDAELKGRVRSVSAIPIGDGVFDALISVKLGDLSDKIVPGMKAKVKIANGKKSDKGREHDEDEGHDDDEDEGHDEEDDEEDDEDEDDEDEDDEDEDDEDEDDEDEDDEEEDEDDDDEDEDDEDEDDDDEDDDDEDDDDEDDDDEDDDDEDDDDDEA